MSTAPADSDRPVDTFEMRLYLARWHAGRLSAKQAAGRVGVADTTWRNWEQGKHVDAAQKPWMLRQIAEALGVDREWLENGGSLTQNALRPDGPEGIDPVLCAIRDSNPEPADLMRLRLVGSDAA